MTTNVVRGRDGNAGFFLDGNAGAIDASNKTCALKFSLPGAEIHVVNVRQAAAFLDVQENNRSWNETFYVGNGRGGTGIVNSFRFRIIFIFKFAAIAAAIQN